MMIRNNGEMINRFREAAGYQRKAIRVLFPEKMGAHLDVIENEIKMMVVETAMDLVKDYGMAIVTPTTDSKQDSKSKSKKVDIS